MSLRSLISGAASGGLVVLVAFAIACLLVPNAKEATDRAAAVAVFLVVGQGAMALVAGLQRFGVADLGAVGVVAAGCAGAVWWFLPGEVVVAAGSVVIAAVLLPFLWVAPLRALGLSGGAILIALLISASSLATPYLAGFRGYGAVPAWVLEWNPLALLLGSVLGQDWLRGPLLYPLIGEGYIRYPEITAPALPATISTAVCAVSAIGAAAVRRLSKLHDRPD